MRPRDTATAAYDAQIAWYRRLSAADRVVLAASMSEDARAITCAGIRARHPEYTAHETSIALVRLLVGDEAYQRAWPDAPLLPP
jgi:hypothetical protein